jgi:thioredoxin reductase (NADPH)
MQKRAFDNPKIRFRWNTTAEDVTGDARVDGLIVRDEATSEVSTLPVTGVFIAIGHNPRSDLVRGQVNLGQAGYVVTQGRSSRTNLAGVFACGDLVDGTYRQAITAAGSGCSAALGVDDTWPPPTRRSDEDLPNLRGLPARTWCRRDVGVHG